MPELPEVETTRRGLEMFALKRRITSVNVHRRDLRTPVTKGLEKAVTGQKIMGLRRRAKYLLIDLEGGNTLLVHLGMSGSMVAYPQKSYEKRTHDHVVLTLDDGQVLVFNDPRRFGVFELIKAGAEAKHPALKTLGPEPLSKDFSAKYLSSQLVRRKGPIKPVLMDQKLVVGVGNIYASEALHFCGLHPNLPAHKAATKSAEIITAIQRVLEAAIASGGSTLRDYVGVQNQGGYFQHQFRVYDRCGEPCFSCSAMIEIGTHAGRSTYWCPQCQRNPATRQKH